MATQKKNTQTAALNSLDFHISKIVAGERKFENVFQSISRMILGDPKKIKRITVNGRSTYDFEVFRQDNKHIIGMFDEINSFVSFVKDAAEGGSSAEMAFARLPAGLGVKAKINTIYGPHCRQTYFRDYSRPGFEWS